MFEKNQIIFLSEFFLILVFFVVYEHIIHMRFSRHNNLVPKSVSYLI